MECLLIQNQMSQSVHRPTYNELAKRTLSSIHKIINNLYPKAIYYIKDQYQTTIGHLVVCEFCIYKYDRDETEIQHFIRWQMAKTRIKDYPLVVGYCIYHDPFDDIVYRVQLYQTSI